MIAQIYIFIGILELLITFYLIFIIYFHKYIIFATQFNNIMETKTAKILGHIRAFAKSRLNPDLFIVQPREKNKEDYLCAIFLSKDAYNDYLKGIDSEDYIIYANKNNFTTNYSFSKSVLIPGTYMHKDGSGEPDSYEMEESEILFTNLADCFIAILGSIRETQNDEFTEALMELTIDIHE